MTLEWRAGPLDHAFATHVPGKPGVESRPEEEEVEMRSPHAQVASWFGRTVLAGIVFALVVVSPAAGQAVWVKHGIVMDPGVNPSWDDQQVHTPRVLFDGASYQMWFTGFSFRTYQYLFGYATSSDGVTWLKHPGNPVFDLNEPSGWPLVWVHFPNVSRHGDRYKMWYAGGYHDGVNIGYAESLDGTNWTKSPANPVLRRGAAGTFDSWQATGPEVLFDGETYHMWYTAIDDRHDLSVVGYASSADGITWTKYPSPVLTLGPAAEWDGRCIGSKSVIREPDGTFTMFYSGYGTANQIGLATSPDGIHWTKDPANPVLRVTTEMFATDPVVIRDGSTYKMWYACGNPADSYPQKFHICYATSQAPDSTPPIVEPVVTGTLGANGWYTSDVTVNWTVTDAESDVTARSGCDTLSVTEDTAGITLSCSATSAGGTQTGTVTIKRDTTAPSIVVQAPVSTAYLLNQAIQANYSCVDTGSGVDVCDGSVPSGGAVPTSVAAAHDFVVVATDAAGNRSTVSVGYTVGYQTCLLYDPSKAHKSGSTVPIKLQLCDASGGNVSSAAVGLTATGVARASTDAPGILDDSGNSSPDLSFRFDPMLGSGGGYIFNLSLKGFGTGTYYLSFTAGADTAIHRVLFQVK
jgi:predicted GH43/DUF377 family glycosyl hydrolase